MVADRQRGTSLSRFWRPRRLRGRAPKSKAKKIFCALADRQTPADNHCCESAADTRWYNSGLPALHIVCHAFDTRRGVHKQKREISLLLFVSRGPLHTMGFEYSRTLEEEDWRCRVFSYPCDKYNGHKQQTSCTQLRAARTAVLASARAPAPAARTRASPPCRAHARSQQRSTCKRMAPAAPAWACKSQRGPAHYCDSLRRLGLRITAWAAHHCLGLRITAWACKSLRGPANYCVGLRITSAFSSACPRHAPATHCAATSAAFNSRP